jgi:hypothetical protein
VEFGALWGGQPAEQVRVLEDDERIGFLMDGERTLSVAVHEPFDIDPAAIPAIWGEPRLLMPTTPSRRPEPLLAVRRPREQRRMSNT